MVFRTLVRKNIMAENMYNAKPITSSLITDGEGEMELGS